jgi:hypothetical protein
LPSFASNETAFTERGCNRARGILGRVECTNRIALRAVEEVDSKDVNIISALL